MIKILFIGASPQDEVQLRLAEEVRAIDLALRESELGRKLELVQHGAVRASDLQGLLLRHKPDYVHFSGHGSTESEILVQDEVGNSHPISGEQLKTLFSLLKKNVKCVILNACYTESQARTIASEINFVIGMNDEISDRSAINFSKSFYRALGYGELVPVAFELGKLEIDMSALGEQDRPQLFSRLSHHSQDVDIPLHQFIAPIPEVTIDPVQQLLPPGGAIRSIDTLYIERSADKDLQWQLSKIGTTTTIRAPRQTGKTSLLARNLRSARRNNYDIVFLDFQGFDVRPHITQEDFLYQIADTFGRELRLEERFLDSSWRTSQGPQRKLTYFLEDYVLTNRTKPLILAIDEADRLLATGFHQDFFGLLRSWHNLRAIKEEWEFLNIVLVISNEPYLLIEDNQSPFNVGLQIELYDFDLSQTCEVNNYYGSPLRDDELHSCQSLLNGHPFLTRQICFNMAVKQNTWQMILPTLTRETGPVGAHLLDLHKKLLTQPALVAATKQIIRFGNTSDDLSLYRLLKAGIVKGSGDAYTCRCGLYEQFLRERLL